AGKEVHLALGPGEYFWRIRTPSSVITETRQFRVANAAVLKPVFPAPNQKVLSWGEDGSVQFRLLSPTGAGGAEDIEAGTVEHKIEVASDQEFKKVVRSETVHPGNGNATLKGVSEGEYYWRVKSRYGDLLTTSPAEKFKVEKGHKISLELRAP